MELIFAGKYSFAGTKMYLFLYYYIDVFWCLVSLR